MANLQGLEGLMAQVKSASDSYLLAENAQQVASTELVRAEADYIKISEMAKDKKKP